MMKHFILFIFCLNQIFQICSNLLTFIPANRIPSIGWSDIQWNDPFPNSWTIVNVATHGIYPNSGNIVPLVETLISTFNADDPIILYFPPGVYNLDSRISIGRSNLIIRGAGPEYTTFSINTNTGAISVRGRGNRYDWEWFSWTYARNITADVAPGGTVVQVNDVSDLNVGDFVLVYEDLDEGLYTYDIHCRGGSFIIEAINGNDITLNFPLEIGLDNVVEKHAILTQIRAVENFGVEGIKFIHPGEGQGGGNTIHYTLVHNSFVRNIHSINTNDEHIVISQSHHVIVEGNFLDEAKFKGGGGNGYGVDIRDLTTYAMVTNNIIKDTRHAIAFETGSNYNVFSYNFLIDTIRDYCWRTDEDICEDESWINDVSRNGMSSSYITTDVVSHGNFAHYNNIEGNIFYCGTIDHSHQLNGPTMFFRNKALGQPDKYGGWLEGIGFCVQGENDNQTIVANHLLNDATTLLQLHLYTRTAWHTVEGGNVIQGAVDWKDFESTTVFPSSLYLSSAPSFWRSEIPFPPFGPDVTNSETNKIPAQVRYEEMLLSSYYGWLRDLIITISVSVVLTIIIISILLVVLVVIFFAAFFFTMKKRERKD